MQVAVIGGGVIGVCTAYFLAAAGHEVVVIERYGNVAQETSFGNAGMIAPGYAAPWAAPGMPRKILSYLFRPETPVLLKPSLDPALWRWIRKWLAECEIERYRINKGRMQRIALYSQALLQQISAQHGLEYEQTSGVLQLLRTKHDLRLAQPALEMLGAADVEHRLVDADAAKLIEPGLSDTTKFAAALYLPRDESGNCPLFTRQLKNIAQSVGVEFHFNSRVDSIETEHGRVGFQIDKRRFSADAVVISAGTDSADLLKQIGIRIPVYPVKGYCATAHIKNFERAPNGAVMDESYKVAITRMGSRIRIAGTAELGSTTPVLHERALRTLIKVGEDWFPDAANFHNSTFWCGARPMLPDGAPLLGATPLKNVFINIGDGSSDWTMAAGSGKIVADLVSGRVPEIDTDGLTLARYG